jgi:potassium channel subfamily K
MFSQLLKLLYSFFLFHSMAEFIIYKLKEMGKISQEDISLIMEEFEDLDVDQSGTLSASDIMLAQSSLAER